MPRFTELRWGQTYNTKSREREGGERERINKQIRDTF